MFKVAALYHQLLAKAHDVVHKLCHKAEVCGHCTYLGLVSWEAHGYYRFAAGILLLIIIIVQVIEHVAKETIE